MSDPSRRPEATFVIRVHNRSGALARIASLFHRRALNIQTLTVAPTADAADISEMMLRTAAPAPELERVAAAIANLVDVVSVEVKQAS